jgi:hypothetical protein
MAIKLENKVNTEAPSVAYPFGNIKDNTGSNNGTPVDKNVYADFHQFFAKMMDESGIAYNDLPDNNTDGFQYWLSLVEAVKNNCNFYTDISASITVNGSFTPVLKIAREYADGTIFINCILGFTTTIPKYTNILSGLPNSPLMVFGAMHGDETTTLFKDDLWLNGSGQLSNRFAAFTNPASPTNTLLLFSLSYKKI